MSSVTNNAALTKIRIAPTTTPRTQFKVGEFTINDHAETTTATMPVTIRIRATIRRVLKAVRKNQSMERFKVPLWSEIIQVNDVEWLPKFVERYLSFTGKCFRHCDGPTSMKVILQDPTRIIGAYACPDGFVSQVVYFSQKPNLKWFSDTIVNQVGSENFTTNDVRVATRHGWELGGDAVETLEAQLGVNPSVTEVYWTRYPRTEAQKQIAVSLCTGDVSHPGCLRLFAHDRNKIERLCPTCRRS